MGADTKIEWCDHTFNPWEGCTKVSPGCAHCYAEARNARFSGGTAALWGKGKPRRRTSAAYWRQPLKWNKAEQGKIVSHAEFVANRRPRVFSASLADWLDDEVPAGWLSDFLCLIRACGDLDFLLLTKRAELWQRRMNAVVGLDDLGSMIASEWLAGRAPRNVWVGTTVEDQQRADERIPHLLKIPAKVRFLSCEPLLGPVHLFSGLYVKDRYRGIVAGGRGIHWVICGGESGPKARPMHPDWARSLRDQSQAAGVPFLFKQWGEWVPVLPVYTENDDVMNEGNLDRQISLDPSGFVSQREDPDDPSNVQPEQGAWVMERVGKSAAGRLLDGIEHNQFPAS